MPFGFFSEPPPLEERFRQALSVHFQKDKEVLKKLAQTQSALSIEIPPEENIILITYGTELYRDGFGIITDRRVMRFKKKLEQQITHSVIAEREMLVFPNGNFTIELLGRAAVPYKNFDPRDMSSKVFDTYSKNKVDVSMPTLEARDEFLRALETAKMMGN